MTTLKPRRPLVASLVASLVALTTFGAAVFVATTEAPAQANTATAPKIGLIDMAHVFKNYKKFEALRNDLKAEIEQSDLKAKAMAAELTDLQKRMKTFKEGSPQYLELEKQLAQKASEWEAFRKVAQRDFLRKEADIYKTVYLEVTDTVKQYAHAFHFSLIIRFSREEITDTGDPETILRSMNRQIVYNRAENDITDSILKYLNERYAKQRTAGGTTGNATN